MQRLANRQQQEIAPGSTANNSTNNSYLQITIGYCVKQVSVTLLDISKLDFSITQSDYLNIYGVLICNSF